MRRERRACKVCGKKVWHVAGRPWAGHAKSLRHRAALTVIVVPDGAELERA